MQNQRIISLDADETLIGGLTVHYKLFHLGHGYAFDEAVFQATHSWNAATQMTSEELGRNFAEFLLSEDCPVSIPIPGAQHAVQLLGDIAHLPVLTARTEDTRQKTMAELAKHFEGRLTEAWFGTNGIKHEIVQRHGFHIHVDDSVNECRKIVETVAEAHVILFCNPVLRPPIGLTHPRLVVLPTCWYDCQDATSPEIDAILHEAWHEAIEAIMDIRERYWKSAVR